MLYIFANRLSELSYFSRHNGTDVNSQTWQVTSKKNRRKCSHLHYVHYKVHRYIPGYICFGILLGISTNMLNGIEGVLISNIYIFLPDNLKTFAENTNTSTYKFSHNISIPEVELDLNRHASFSGSKRSVQVIY